MLTGLGLAVQFTGRNIVPQTVNLVVSPPQVAVCRVEIMANRIADASCENLAASAVGLDPDNTTDPDLIIQR